jgi:WD40 repeat protein
MQLRVFNYNTHEKVHSWDAHSDYIRCIAVHPTLPYVLSGSDDMTIRLWDWDKNWKCMQVGYFIYWRSWRRSHLNIIGVLALKWYLNFFQTSYSFRHCIIDLRGTHSLYHDRYH